MPNQAPHIHTLDNGMRLALWPQPHLHSLGIGLYVKVGPRFENPNTIGISHFLEHVLFRGNATYQTSLEMNRAFEAWGGSINAYTTREYTYFYGKLHPDYLREGIAFMSDLVREPRFAEIDLEREIILEERLQDVDADGQILEEDDISREYFWKGHPLSYPIIGTPRTLRNIREDELKKHFTHFYGTNHFVLCLTGSFSQDQAIAFSQESFQQFRQGAPIPTVPPPPEKPAQPTAFVYNDSSQVSLLLSFKGPNPTTPSFLPMLLLDRILDDGMSSRLWQRLVENKGLCYELWASIDSYSDTSIFEVGASVAPDKVLPLVEGIYNELKRLRDDGPSDEEFNLARRRLQFGEEFVLDKVSELNERLGSHVLYGPAISIQEQMQRIANLTKDDVVQTANQLFQESNQLLTAVGPLTKSTKRKLRELAKIL